MVTFESWKEDLTLPEFPMDSESKGASEVLQWAYDQYGEQLVYACSFGIEGIVLLELISRVKADAKIIFLDTNYHFKETYETIDKVKNVILSSRFIYSNPLLQSKNKLSNTVPTYGKPIRINAVTCGRSNLWKKRSHLPLHGFQGCAENNRKHAKQPNT